MKVLLKKKGESQKIIDVDSYENLMTKAFLNEVDKENNECILVFKNPMKDKDVIEVDS